ncbi:MAG TPA: glycosyltransferase [Pyrinomonadaceae bacterium]|nr:glycosyltransferase [Pyrinomonadaceae bacterium]
MSNAARKSGLPATHERARSFGKKCNRIYESMLRRLKAKTDPEASLNWMKVAAEFAWTFHPGRYADGRIENPALEIGRKLQHILPKDSTNSATPNVPLRQNSSRKRVLHVATTLYPVGGHSRLIKNWIENDRNSVHSTLLTDQVGEIPQWMTQTVTENGGCLFTLPSKSSLVQKAWSLRSIAQDAFDLVVLHPHPHDVVPIVAFGSDDCPPVALMNHADHVFWLGTSIADIVLNIRGFADRISETRRFAKKSFLLPVPLSIPALSVTKPEARRLLNIPEDQIVLLTISTPYKFTPTDTHDFFVTAGQILTQNPAAHLYVIGIRPDQSDQYLRDGKIERLHFLGAVEDPTLYRLSADLYLDSMPYGSLMALLETAAFGVCPVLMYAPPAPQYDMSEELEFSGLVTCSESEDQYIAKINHLIAHPEVRQEIGARARERVLSYHQGKQWQEYLASAYEQLNRSGHRPAEISNAEFMQTTDDLALWDFNHVRYFNSSLLRPTAEKNYQLLTLKDIIVLFLISLTVRDYYSRYDIRVWLQMLGSKLLRTQ